MGKAPRIRKPLTDKYRPSALEQFAGNPKAAEQARVLRARGVGGRAIWISGPSGSGKTTLGRILAREIADDFFITELVARQLTPRDVQEIESTSRLYALGKGGRAWIINEGHGLRSDVIQSLLQLLESGEIPRHCLFVFTTTHDGQDQLFEDEPDAGPLLSRMSRIALKADSPETIAQWARQIARREKLDGRPLADYIDLARRCRGNRRAILEAIDEGAMRPRGNMRRELADCISESEQRAAVATKRAEARSQGAKKAWETMRKREGKPEAQP